MNTDEQFAEGLRAQVTRVAPKIDVDVTGVVPAARRRRAGQVGGLTLAMGLVLGGGAWAATTLEMPGAALPGGSMTMQVEPSPEPSGPPVTSSEGDRLIEEGEPTEGPIVPPEGWRDATYFHVVTRGEVTKQGEERADDSPLGIERWYGDGVSFQLTAHGPQLIDVRGFVGFEGADPVSFTWAEIAALPTGPEALHEALLSKFEPTGHGEDAALDAAARLITDSPAPTAVRAAAWELLSTLPDVTVEQDARDSEDRLGTAASFAVFDRSWTIVYDEARDVPLEAETSIGKMREVDTYLTTEFTSLPEDVADSAIEIPDFTAMAREDAEVACLQKHLACTFQDTESDTAPSGTIISSDPAPGALVTWGAPVTLLLSTGP
jgi:hypothetical protein